MNGNHFSSRFRFSYENSSAPLIWAGPEHGLLYTGIWLQESRGLPAVERGPTH